MTLPYRAWLLLALDDGDWHAAAELEHPYFHQVGLEAWIRLLRASGHEIEREGEGRAARYRLVAQPPADG
jgi:hypothetical protein